jgi:ATP-dependent DNA ligase
MSVNQGQELVIGGYTPSGRNFDAIIFGYYDEEGRLLYVARTRNGFTPASRDELFNRFRGLETGQCPFVNLEARSGRWGQGLTAEKMAKCRWLKSVRRPVRVRRVDPGWPFEALPFFTLSEDKQVHDVRRESTRPHLPQSRPRLRAKTRQPVRHTVRH